MSIKAIANKQIGLRSEGKIIVMEPLVYTELPDSVQADPLYGWAIADGTLQVIGEEDAGKKKTAKAKDAAV